MTREDVSNALFDLLTASGAYRTSGRRLIFASKVADQPALFLRNTGEEWDRVNTRMPAKVTMEFEVWLYSRLGADPETAPAVGLNDLVADVAAAIDPFPLQTQTLGGAVIHCWIEGHIDMHPGDLDGQAIAIVPVKVLVPSFGG